MIIIQSKEDIENTTEQVIDWLDYYGQSWWRLNGEDLLRNEVLRATLPSISLQVAGTTLPVADVRVVWHRRGGRYKIDLPSSALPLHYELLAYLKAEGRALREGLPSFFPLALHLDHPDAIGLNKLDVLHRASQLGLHVPQTLITNYRSEVIQFANECGGSIITKSLYETNEFTVGDNRYIINTQLVDPEKLPASFYVTLFQEELRKDYELRVFCLEERLYAMAIFSQLDEQTQVDFRNYNVQRPNRVVPYEVPETLGKQILQLLHQLNLTNGSVDLVRTLEGEYVFLEVNPTGQFSMVSEPCNYHLEKCMAEFLCNKHNEREPTYPDHRAGSRIPATGSDLAS